MANGPFTYGAALNITSTFDWVAAKQDVNVGGLINLNFVEERMPTGDGDRHSNPLRAWCESLAGEIRSSIGYYVAQPEALNIERVLLSGRGARLVGLPGRLEESLGLSVDILRPLEGMAVQNSTGGPDITYEAPDFAVCLGLALRGLAG